MRRFLVVLTIACLAAGSAGAAIAKPKDKVHGGKQIHLLGIVTDITADDDPETDDSITIEVLRSHGGLALPAPPETDEECDETDEGTDEGHDDGEGSDEGTDDGGDDTTDDEDDGVRVPEDDDEAEDDPDPDDESDSEDGDEAEDEDDADDEGDRCDESADEESDEARDEVTILLVAGTRFGDRGHGVSSAADLHAGDRVRIDAVLRGDDLVARRVKLRG